MRRTRVERDWSAAWLHHRELAAPSSVRCRGCGASPGELAVIDRRLELAHLWGRVADRRPPIGWTAGVPWEEPYLVVPWRVVLLCGPSTSTETCHGRYDSRRRAGGLDLLGKLTLIEELQAVADAGRLHEAYRRLTGGLPP